MKIKITLLLLCSSMLLTLACKKDKPDSSFSPDGYWNGNVFIYNSYLLNQANGVSKFYWRVPGTDTTDDKVVKFYGHYRMDGSILRGSYAYPGGDNDSLLLETFKITPDFISGRVVSTLTGEAVPFELYRQR